MPLKADWNTHLRAIRLRETELVFCRCPDGAFDPDYQRSILAGVASPRLTFQACDAERADESFPAGSFDLVFSSNLLEHVSDVQRALAATRTLLAPGGLAIHIMPGVEWKLAQLALHYPNLLALMLDRLRGPKPAARPQEERPNNAKQPERLSRWKLLWPQPHGVSRTNLGELIAFRRARWLREFSKAGLELIAALPGPVSSGYGFGFDRLRARLERAGISAETAYVVARPGEATNARAWFAA